MLTAVILAGGQGLRLRAVVSDLPKVLAPVAGRRFGLVQVAESGAVRSFEEKKSPATADGRTRASVFSPGGAVVGSQGRKPLEENAHKKDLAPEGRKVVYRPSEAENDEIARNV